MFTLHYLLPNLLFRLWYWFEGFWNLISNWFSNWLLDSARRCPYWFPYWLLYLRLISSRHLFELFISIILFNWFVYLFIYFQLAWNYLLHFFLQWFYCQSVLLFIKQSFQFSLGRSRFLGNIFRLYDLNLKGNIWI